MFDYGSNMMNGLQQRDTVGVADIAAAAERIAGEAVRTPLLASALLDERVGGRVLLKCECLQRTGSFKFRGAYNALASLDPDARGRGVVAVSSGNHAQGVAEAARIFGVPATVVMPEDAPAIKRDRARRSGATVIGYDRSREDRDAVAAAVLAQSGGVLIHPYNDPRVIAGQGTAGREIAAQCAGMGIVPDAVLVPCGGGGLGAGIGVAIRDAYPEATLTLVEPEAFDDYGRSLRAGQPIANTATSGSICDALLAPSPGTIGFALNVRNAARAVTVSDEAAMAAVAFAFRELKLSVEPGGAVGLAALLSGGVDGRDRTTVVVLSGGNVDEAVLREALSRPAI
mgnify:CR=1 FL=1